MNNAKLRILACWDAIGFKVCEVGWWKLLRFLIAIYSKTCFRLVWLTIRIGTQDEEAANHL